MEHMDELAVENSVTWPHLSAREPGKSSLLVYSGRREEHGFG